MAGNFVSLAERHPSQLNVGFWLPQIRAPCPPWVEADRAAILCLRTETGRTASGPVAAILRQGDEVNVLAGDSSVTAEFMGASVRAGKRIGGRRAPPWSELVSGLLHTHLCGETPQRPG